MSTREWARAQFDERNSRTDPQPPSRAHRLPKTDLLALTALVAAVIFLWGRGAGKWYWLDEGIAAGISSHPLGEIPALLRQDGSPPLYYLLLNVWMSTVGSSETQTHLLSLIFAVATIPAALWAGWSLFGRRAGWMCAVVAALNPFLAFYANETRMYSLAVLLGVLTVATFSHGFVFRRRRHLPVFAVLLTLLMYTHNWGLLLAAGAVVALVPCLMVATDRRALLVDAALAFGAVGALYAPWLPTLLYQWSEELQPWAQRPTLVVVRDELAALFGGLEGVVALGLGVGIGLVSLLRRPWNRTGAVIAVAAVIPAVVVGAGWLSSVWAYRYLAIVLAPLLLLAGAGLAHGGQAGLAALGVAAFVSAPIATKTPPYQKSNARAVMERASASLRPGDAVISPDLQLVPLLAHYLPDDLRYFTTAGPVPDENIVDWRDSMDRLMRGDPTLTLSPVIDALAPGSRVLLACPPTSTRLASPRPETIGAVASPGQIGASDQMSPAPKVVSPFHQLINRRCDETGVLLIGHPQLRLDLRLLAPSGVTQTAVDGFVLTKLG